MLAMLSMATVASNDDIAELERQIEKNKYEVNQAYSRYLEAKEKLENAQKKLSELKPVTEKDKPASFDDDIPSTAVFNRTREWNKERIIWKDKFWECAEYRDNGTCKRVQVVEGFVVE